MFLYYALRYKCQRYVNKPFSKVKYWLHFLKIPKIIVFFFLSGVVRNLLHMCQSNQKKMNCICYKFIQTVSVYSYVCMVNIPANTILRNPFVLKYCTVYIQRPFICHKNSFVIARKFTISTKNSMLQERLIWPLTCN